MRLSILIMYTGGDHSAIINTITNCRRIVYVDEIMVCGEDVECIQGEESEISMLRLLSDKVSVVNAGSIYEAVSYCSNEWVLLIDEHTVIGTQFIGPLLNEHLNKLLIYYTEHDHPVARYSQYLRVDVDEEFFLNNIGDPNLEQMVGGFNCAFNKKVWLERSTQSSNMLAMNYQCLKNGMVIKVVKGSICKSPAKKALSMNHYHLPVEPNTVEPQKQIKEDNWSACGK